MNVLQELRTLSRVRFFQLLGLAAFLTWAGGRAIDLKYCVLDLDLYWHLAVGNWIVQHHSVPRVGILSYTAATRPWVAYSWGYEVLLSVVYKWFGLLGIGAFGVLMTLGVAGCTYWMCLRLSKRFWVACPLAAAASWSFLFSLMPRPVFFSMMLFMVTLTLILEAQRSGRVQTLYWLPPLFILWANLHIQFIYGLFLLGLLLGITLLQKLADVVGVQPDFLSRPLLPLKELSAVFAACLLASCLGPYSFHLYGVVLQYSQAKLSYEIVNELQPLNFRFIEHYIQLLLAAAGFFVVGWQKKIDPFKLALLTIASLVAFRTMRDSWFICISAAACIADCSFQDQSTEEAHRKQSDTLVEMPILATGVLVLLLLIASNSDFNSRGLDELISSQFPVAAANFLRKNPVQGPLYNNFDWGGFLTWYMPWYPVAIDGRNDLYGDALDRRFVGTEDAVLPYESEPYLTKARVVLLRRNLPLVSLLSSDPGFELIYEDRLAAVFVRR
jgi:hypothetical protein